MAKNLVIVESPAKAKTIEKILGKDFEVKSSFGHIRDLEKDDMGIDIQNNFKPKYIIPEDKEKVVKELKKLVKDSEEVWLATDEDREGKPYHGTFAKCSALTHLLPNALYFTRLRSLPLRKPCVPPPAGHEPGERPTGPPYPGPDRGL